MSIESELIALRNEDGLIVPADVVEWAAANPHSDLYHALEWRNEEAAHQFRLSQVRRLVAVYVRREEDGGRATISLMVDRSNRKGGGYRDMDTVMRHSEMREMALEEALAELKRFEARYAYLQELALTFAEAEKVRASQRARRRVSAPSRAEQRAAV